jgi:hypothetical protein
MSDPIRDGVYETIKKTLDAEKEGKKFSIYQKN